MDLQPFLESNDAIGDPAELRDRARRDGYLFFRGLLEADPVLTVRRDILTLCRDAGWLAERTPLLEGIADLTRRCVEPEPGYMEVYDAVQKLESFHTLAHAPALLAALRTLFGEEVLPHARNIARIIFPQNVAYTTPAHQDHIHIQGTPETYTAWIPLGECPRELGSLCVLAGSHREGLMGVHRAMGAGGVAVATEELPYAWVGGDFALGDVLLFHSMTVHRALANCVPDRLRLSVDYRYQGVSQPLVEASMLPHFNRLTWEQVYAGWRSPRYQFYWRDLPLNYVSFDRSHYPPKENPAPPQPAGASDR